MPNGQANGVWLKVIGITLVVIGALIGVIYTGVTSDIDGLEATQKQDTKTVQGSLASTSNSLIRLEQRVIDMDANVDEDLEEIKAAILRLEAAVSGR